MPEPSTNPYTIRNIGLLNPTVNGSGPTSLYFLFNPLPQSKFWIIGNTMSDGRGTALWLKNRNNGSRGGTYKIEYNLTLVYPPLPDGETYGDIVGAEFLMASEFLSGYTTFNPLCNKVGTTMDDLGTQGGIDGTIGVTFFNTFEFSTESGDYFEAWINTGTDNNHEYTGTFSISSDSYMTLTFVKTENCVSP